MAIYIDLDKAANMSVVELQCYFELLDYFQFADGTNDYEATLANFLDFGRISVRPGDKLRWTSASNAISSASPDEYRASEFDSLVDEFSDVLFRHVHNYGSSFFNGFWEFELKYINAYIIYQFIANITNTLIDFGAIMYDEE